jgi:hypothetical protein
MVGKIELIYMFRYWYFLAYYELRKLKAYNVYGSAAVLVGKKDTE